MYLRPKSDEKLIEKLDSKFTEPIIRYKDYKDFTYRFIGMQKELDTILPTIVFVHGSPGSVLDYKRYLKDSLLNSKANLLTYERVGYGIKNNGDVQASIDFELEILHDVIKELNVHKTVVVGYSYGGTIIMASPKAYHYKISLAGALKAEYEPMFSAMKVYDWKFTRWLLPKQLQAAAKEKYAHLKELPDFNNRWNISPSPVLSIHGEKDWIVPYENTLYLKEVLDKDKLKINTLEDTGHELVWSEFDLIKAEIIKTLN